MECNKGKTPDKPNEQGFDDAGDSADILCDAPDAVTGATPGVATACADLGLSSVDEVVRLKGIKPPGTV